MVKQGKVSSIDIGFPAEVIDSLQVLGPQSWDLIYAAIEDEEEADWWRSTE